MQQIPTFNNPADVLTKSSLPHIHQRHLDAAQITSQPVIPRVGTQGRVDRAKQYFGPTREDPATAHRPKTVTFGDTPLSVRSPSAAYAPLADASSRGGLSSHSDARANGSVMRIGMRERDVFWK